MKYCKAKILFSGNGFEINLDVRDTVSRLINGQVKSKSKILLKLKSTRTERPVTPTDTFQSTLKY